MNESEVAAVVLAQSGNYSVVQIAARRFPAIAVQGDAMKALHETVEELSGYLNSGDLEEAKFTFAEIQETVSSLKSFYEEALGQVGVSLPYVD